MLDWWSDVEKGGKTLELDVIDHNSEVKMIGMIYELTGQWTCYLLTVELGHRAGTDEIPFIHINTYEYLNIHTEMNMVIP